MKKQLICLVAICMVTTSYAGDSLLLVLNKAANNLVFINARDLKILATLPTGEGPHEIVVSENKELAYVANYGQQVPGNSIDIFNIATRTFLKRIDLGILRRPHGLAEKAGKLYFTAEMNRVVGQYDHSTGKLGWLAGTGESVTHMLTLHPDGTKLYTSNILSNTVTLLHVDQPPLPDFIRHIKVGPKPEAISITPSGDEVWVGQNEDGQISVIETAGNTVSKTFPTGKMPIRIQFTPDGKTALISDPPLNELQVVDVASRTVTKRIKIDGAPVGMVISPDGKYLFVARTQHNTVTKIDLSDFSVLGSVETGKNPDGIAVVYR